MLPPLETPRLFLRPLELADAAQVQLLFPHWKIVKYLNNTIPWPYPENGTESYYREVALPDVARGVLWTWTMRLKASPDQIIGNINLRKNEGDNRGFWLAPPWQGQGLMIEACNVVTDFWFDTLGFPVLRVSKAAVNAASRRVSEKQGMRLVATEERDYVSGRYPAEVWELTAAEWRARRSAR